MSALYKILVSNEDGKFQGPVYPIDDGRPMPPDMTWIPVEEGTCVYKLFISTEDVSHLDMVNTYWDFEANEWIEVPTPAQQATRDTVKGVRNALLKISDQHVVEETDPERLAQWLAYRDGLRNLFVGLPDDYDWTKIILPRTPDDIASLKEKAAAGDEEAAAIVLRDNL